MPESPNYFYQGQPVQVLSRRGKTWRVLQNGVEAKIPSAELEPSSPILEALWANSEASSAWALDVLAAAKGVQSAPETFMAPALEVMEAELAVPDDTDGSPVEALVDPAPRWGHKRHSRIGVVAQRLPTGRDRFSRGPSSVTTSRGHAFNQAKSTTLRFSGRG